MKEEHALHLLKKVGGSKFKKLLNNPIKNIQEKKPQTKGTEKNRTKTEHNQLSLAKHFLFF